MLTSVGNRVNEVDLQLSSSATLPCENLTEIQCTAVSPSGMHMLSFDTDGRAILVNLRCAQEDTPRGDPQKSGGGSKHFTRHFCEQNQWTFRSPNQSNGGRALVYTRTPGTHVTGPSALPQLPMTKC